MTLRHDIRIHHAQPVVYATNDDPPCIWIRCSVDNTTVSLFFDDQATFERFARECDSLCRSLSYEMPEDEKQRVKEAAKR